MALGARRSSVLWLVIREALVLVGIGGVIGIPLALVASPSISSILYGVRPADPLAYAAGFVVMFVVAAAAAYLPAWRASRIDPVAALRS
jgi:ABC-type antimicrobial peptide transport system permease subunit